MWLCVFRPKKEILFGSLFFLKKDTTMLHPFIPAHPFEPALMYHSWFSLFALYLMEGGKEMMCSEKMCKIP
jgi:hypothetical protein